MEQPPVSDAADWSKLPADVLTSVLCGLEFPDLFSSAAVCTSWRATARALRRLGRSYTRPQTPCLFHISAAGAELYSVTAGKSYRLPDLPDPPVADRYIWGSPHGWLATADARSELHLLNPATGDQIGLLPVATIEQVTPVLDDAGELSRFSAEQLYQKNLFAVIIHQ
uniref:F-box domain-containing protein n=1 Tax=Arundo donax TaxID=35708 RepID=A0A0A9GMC4_ARUDO